jgi:hypothetical protein
MNSSIRSKQFQLWAKMGYLARGAVYLVIGGLAVLAALGRGGETTDSKGAIIEIMDQPYGSFLLIVLIIGLLGFVAWRLIQAIADTDAHGKSPKGIAIRSGLLASAISHGLLALWTAKLLLGDKEGSQSGGQFLSTDLGQLLIVVAGLVFFGTGLAHMYKGFTASFERYMRIPPGTKAWARPLCQFGLISRGIVWCILAWFCITSALVANDGEIKGIVEAMTFLRAKDYGVWLFGIVAAGLFAFGVYSILQAMYRQIAIEEGLAKGMENIRALRPHQIKTAMK